MELLPEPLGPVTITLIFFYIINEISLLNFSPLGAIIGIYLNSIQESSFIATYIYNYKFYIISFHIYFGGYLLLLWTIQHDSFVFSHF